MLQVKAPEFVHAPWCCYNLEKRLEIQNPQICTSIIFLQTSCSFVYYVDKNQDLTNARLHMLAKPDQGKNENNIVNLPTI